MTISDRSARRTHIGSEKDLVGGNDSAYEAAQGDSALPLVATQEGRLLMMTTNHIDYLDQAVI